MAAAKRPRGRPPFKVTPALQRKVAIAAGGGMSHEAIAMAIGCAKETLEKHFAHELSEGAHAKRLEVIEALHRQAKKGGVAAVKAYLAIQAQYAPPPAPPADGAPARAPRMEPLGKKEQQQEDAKTADKGTEWETLLRGTGPAGSPVPH